MNPQKTIELANASPTEDAIGPAWGALKASDEATASSFSTEKSSARRIQSAPDQSIPKAATNAKGTASLYLNR